MNRHFIACVWLACGAAASAAWAQPAAGRIDRLNAAFLARLESLHADQARAVAVIRESWERDYAPEDRAGFVPDALAVLYPTFRRALDAFDASRPEVVSELLTPLMASDDPFLRATAGYYLARARIDQGRLEEAEVLLTELTAPAAEIEQFTPYAAHVWFLRGFCEASNLRYEPAAKSLAVVAAEFGDAPESVANGAKQLALELERREQGNLAEVSSLLSYAFARLHVADATPRVRERQDQAVALLDKLIKEAEDREKSQCGGGGSGGGQGQKSPGTTPPKGGADQSSAPEGAGRIGDLHSVDKANPGEMWGKMPPAEREKILQSLRDRFPSRYRQLVEQYYRSLAEQK